VKDKIIRGRVAMRKHAALRRMCQKFWQGEQYWYLNAKNELRVLPTAVIDVQGGKPDHRIRNSYEFLHSIIEAKVSAASQSVPGYRVDATTADPEDKAAARLSEHVAYYGYDKWHLRRHTIKAITNALVQREGFTMPYFDPNVGPFKQNADGEWVGQGEIRHLDLSRSEVMWELGVDFDDSRWHAIERAQLIEDIKAIPGYIGGDLKSDASTADLPSDKKTDEMALVDEVLERPCKEYPHGRRMFIAAGRVIVDYRKDPACPEDWSDWWEPFPNIDEQGNAVDEPCIMRLSWTVNPDGDDTGLVERLLDLARTINDCWNKLLEWKNRCLMPQMSAPKGANVTRRDDTPGATWYYNVIGGMKPEWERTPPVPQELFQMLELAITHMRAIAADIDVQPDPGLAARTANAAVEQSKVRWQSFLGDLEEFHSRLMRRDLTLVARHYTEKRIIDIRGQYGWEPPVAFTGSDLLSQTNVRVLPGSIEAHSREQATQEIQLIQTLWPGAIPVEAALAVMHGSPAAGLMRSYEGHVARAWGLVQEIRSNYRKVMDMPSRFDTELGDAMTGFQVPGWMPRKQDNVKLWKQVIADYMVTPDYDSQPVEVQHMFDLIWDGLEFSEQRRAMMIAQQEQAMAADLGMGNAAAPQNAPPVPQQQGLTAEQAAPAATAPQNQ
jgi:hypothetical protein